MLKAIRRYLKSTFGNQPAEDLARANLLAYQTAYLKHQCDAAWNAKMAEFYREGIERMRAFEPIPTPKQLELKDL